MLLRLRARRDADARRVRRRRPRRGPHVRRRGAGLPRGPAGPAVRRTGRQAPGAAARVHRHDARAGLHRQRPQEPAAQQPRPAPRGDRRLPAVPVAADRDHPAQGHLHARQLRDQAAERGPARHHQGARAAARRRRSRGTGSTCIRSSTRPPRCTRRPTSRRSKRTSCGCRSSWRTRRRSPGKRRPSRRPRRGRPGGRPSICARRRPGRRPPLPRRRRSRTRRRRRSRMRRRRRSSRGSATPTPWRRCRDAAATAAAPPSCRRPRSPQRRSSSRIRSRSSRRIRRRPRSPRRSPCPRRRPLRRPVRPPNRSSSASSR